MLSMSKGYDPGYLTRQVARGQEGYYLSATAGGGEPAGRWTGRGCAELGLVGEVENDVMTAVYAHLLDPRDPDRKATLGKTPRTYKSAEQIAAELLAAEPNATPERVAEIEAEAANKARAAVMFFDLTFSPGKSTSLLHASLQAAAVKARESGDLEGAARYDAQAEAVWSAVRAGSAAAMDYLQDVAGYTRTGYHGAIPRDPVTGRRLADHSTGRFEDAHEWVIASFDQHTSRENDPQLHIHNAVLNRVKCADGEYRTLDSRAIFKARQAAAAIGERVMEEQLTRDLGVKWAMRPDGKGREIVGITDRTREAFSSRRVAIRSGVAELVEAFKAKHGYEPSRRAVFHMAQFVTVDTRQGKATGPAPDREAMLARWETQATAAELGALADIPEQVIGRVDVEQARSVADLAEAEIRRVCEAAVAQVEGERSEWTRHHLTAAINRHLPDSLGGLPAETVRALLVDLTAGVLAPGAGYGIHRIDSPSLVAEPAEWLREDGTSIYGPRDRARYATARQLGAEEKLLAAGAVTGAPRAELDSAAAALGADRVILEAVLAGTDPARVRELVAAHRSGSDGGRSGSGRHPYGSDGGRDGSGGRRGGSESGAAGSDGKGSGIDWAGGLRDDQAAAVFGILTSGRRIDILIGPAGAGKSRAMGELSDLWREQVGGRVVGLAVSQNAAEVLAGEGCQDTANVAAFLTAYRSGQAGLRPGDLVVVDEASMITSGQLSEINAIAEQAGAKILLTGDPEQLAAVGGAGVMGMMARDHGHYQLTEVQRMREAWERQASLLLRRGDVAALHMYDARGRLLEGTGEQMTETAYRRWLGDHLAGKSTMLLSATTAEARELAARARAELVDLGLVEEHGVTIREGLTAGVGDRVMARTNFRYIADTDGRRVTNRDVLVIDGWIYSPDREQADPIAARVRRDLGADEQGLQQWSAPYAVGVGYLAEHAELGYASTVHAAQGRTVDTCHAVVRPGIGRSMLYVMMTRGREASYAYTVTDRLEAELDPRAAGAPEIAEAERRAALVAAGVPSAGEAIAAAGPLTGGRFAVLADALESAEGELAALEVLRDEHLRSTHLGHLGALWTEATRQATARRFEAALADVLTAEQYARYAAAEQDGPRSTLARLVRAAELAGHDPAALAVRAVTCRALDGERDPADSIAKVLHHRIKGELGTDEPRPLPADTFADRTPAALDGPGAELLDYARRVATVMDDRAAELGGHVAERTPEWAARHLGPVPADLVERLEWERRAAIVQSYREQFDRLDERTAIGHCPNTPEARVAWNAAYDALGRPEEERGLSAMTTGELWIVREQGARAMRFAPERVADELRDVAAAHEHYQAELRIERERAATLRGAERIEAEQREANLGALVETLAADRHAFAQMHEAREAWVEATAEVCTKSVEATRILTERFPDAELPALVPEPLLPEVSLARDAREAARQEREAAAGEGREEAAREQAGPDPARDVCEGQVAFDFDAAELVEEERARAERERLAAERAEADRQAEQEEADRQAERDRENAERNQQQEIEHGLDLTPAETPDQDRDEQRQEEARQVEGQLELDFAAAAREDAEQRQAERQRQAAEREQAARDLEREEAERQAERDRENAERNRQQEVEHGLDKLPDGTRVRPDLMPLAARLRAALGLVDRAEEERKRKAEDAERDTLDREAEESRRAVRQRARRRQEDVRARSEDLDEEGRTR